MSNDLISRSELLVHLRGNVLVDATTELEKAIENEEVAYDVDKVVEQLELHKTYYESRAAEYDERGDLQNMDISDSIVLAYGKAIEIVKAGGKE